MKLRNHGRNTLKTEIVNISVHGIWLSVNGSEYFLSYKDFPWFKDATITQVQNVHSFTENYLHWPDLDVDLEVDSLMDPKKYPLIYK